MESSQPQSNENSEPLNEPSSLDELLHQNKCLFVIVNARVFPLARRNEIPRKDRSVIALNWAKNRRRPHCPILIE